MTTNLQALANLTRVYHAWLREQGLPEEITPGDLRKSTHWINLTPEARIWLGSWQRQWDELEGNYAKDRP